MNADSTNKSNKPEHCLLNNDKRSSLKTTNLRLQNNSILGFTRNQMKQYFTLIIAITLLPLLLSGKDKQKIEDIEKDSSKEEFTISITAKYSSPDKPDIFVEVEVSYLADEGTTYFGGIKNNMYHYHIRNGSKWAEFKFKVDLKDLPQGKISGFYVKLYDKDSEKLEDEDGWKVSKTRYPSWKETHSASKELNIFQIDL